MLFVHSRSARRDRRREADAQAEPDYRFTLANERTLLAYLRTSMAVSAGGAGILVFGEELSPVLVGASSVALGVAAAAVAISARGRWRSVDTSVRMRRPLPRPRLLASFVVILSACIGLTVAVASLVQLVTHV